MERGACSQGAENYTPSAFSVMLEKVEDDFNMERMFILLLKIQTHLPDIWQVFGVIYFYTLFN